MLMFTYLTWLLLRLIITDFSKFYVIYLIIDIRINICYLKKNIINTININYTNDAVYIIEFTALADNINIYGRYYYGICRRRFNF